LLCSNTAVGGYKGDQKSQQYLAGGGMYDSVGIRVSIFGEKAA
jgi:hypothetical protein